VKRERPFAIYSFGVRFLSEDNGWQCDAWEKGLNRCENEAIVELRLDLYVSGESYSLSRCLKHAEISHKELHDLHIPHREV